MLYMIDFLSCFTVVCFSQCIGHELIVLFLFLQHAASAVGTASGDSK